MKLDFFKFFQGKSLKVILLAIVCLIVLLIIFWAGLMVGLRKADFSCRWGENYHRNFAGPQNGFFDNFRKDFGGRDFIDPHGIFGQVLKIDGQILIVRGPDNIEKNILVTPETIINRFQEKINLVNLKIGDAVVVIGEPNESGQVAAKLIRLMPAPRPLPGQMLGGDLPVIIKESSTKN